MTDHGQNLLELPVESKKKQTEKTIGRDIASNSNVAKARLAKMSGSTVGNIYRLTAL